jgi:hypothetical protein
MTAVDYKPAALVPVTDPLELRDRTVRDYKRNAERMGVQLSTSDVEKLATADLVMVAASREEARAEAAHAGHRRSWRRPTEGQAAHRPPRGPVRARVEARREVGARDGAPDADH